MFLLRLASHLRITRRELLERVDSRELSMWLAYDRVEGIPDPHFGPAMIAWTVHCVHGGRLPIERFYPHRPGLASASASSSPRGQTSADHKATMARIRETHNAARAVRGQGQDRGVN